MSRNEWKNTICFFDDYIFDDVGINVQKWRHKILNNLNSTSTHRHAFYCFCNSTVTTKALTPSSPLPHSVASFYDDPLHYIAAAHWQYRWTSQTFYLQICLFTYEFSSQIVSFNLRIQYSRSKIPGRIYREWRDPPVLQHLMDISRYKFSPVLRL